MSDRSFITSSGRKVYFEQLHVRTSTLGFLEGSAEAIRTEVLRRLPDEVARTYGRTGLLLREPAAGWALAGQRQFERAEPVLLEAYHQLKFAQEPSARSRARDLAEAASRICDLYNDWGRPDQVAEWKTRLQRLPY